jgi:hypothetical protein
MEGLAVIARHACANSTALATPGRPAAVRTRRALPKQLPAGAAWSMPAMAGELMPHTAHALALPCCPEHCGALAANGRTAQHDCGAAPAALARRCAGRRRTDRHACTLRLPATRKLCVARHAPHHRRTRRCACDLLSTMTANVRHERQTTARALLAKQHDLARRCSSARWRG